MSQVLFNEIMFYLIALTAIIVSLIGIKACMDASRLRAENERLKKMNAGQRTAIEELQDKNWLLQDILEMERGA